MSLVLRGIRHSYDRTLVVDGATLEAAPGEIVCLVGASGCGKTTLLRIAAGLEPLRDGAVELDGETLSSPSVHVPPERRAVGFVFQDYVLFPHMTVEENIAFGLSERRADDRQKRVDEEVEAVGLAGLERRYPHQLSGGQQQRAALARALVRRPRALLLDEPFASIDSTLRRRLRGDLRRLLKARGAPAILVTHDPEEAIEIGDRVAIMQEGRIIEDAAPETLYRAPRTIAGALLFPGARLIRCRKAEAGVDTDFGPIPEFLAPADASALVVHAGGASLAPHPQGPGRVVDCHFSGPAWIAIVEPASTGAETLSATSPTPLAPGERVNVSFNPERVRAFRA